MLLGKFGLQTCRAKLLKSLLLYTHDGLGVSGYKFCLGPRSFKLDLCLHTAADISASWTGVCHRGRFGFNCTESSSGPVLYGESALYMIFLQVVVCSHCAGNVKIRLHRGCSDFPSHSSFLLSVSAPIETNDWRRNADVSSGDRANYWVTLMSSSNHLQEMIDDGVTSGVTLAPASVDNKVSFVYFRGHITTSQNR